ncbi:MAG: VanW family protein [Eggerthellaceae bacterium]|nr:VanW family protein [Eggerthellaceae bacterium]
MTSALMASKPLLIIAVVVAAILLAGLVDNLSNLGKAYGNVSIAGVNVSGMDKSHMKSALEECFGNALDGKSVKLYANQQSYDTANDEAARLEAEALAEQVAVEDATQYYGAHVYDAQMLGAHVDIDAAIDSALAKGRSDGGLPGRLSLFLNAVEIPVSVSFDEGLLDNAARELEEIGASPRTDATIAVSEGFASPVEGKSGSTISRRWFAGRLSDAFLQGDETVDVIAEYVEDPSRTSYEQAEEAAKNVNNAIGAGAKFEYGESTWNAKPGDVGEWIKAETVEGTNGYEIALSVDPDKAMPKIVTSVDAVLHTDDVTITFSKTDDGVMLETSGDAGLPNAAEAVEKFDDLLFGRDGRAWKDEVNREPVTVSITSSDAPETLSFAQAVELGLIGVVGEYTTEFSDAEGTENRNHNIKLVSDILDNSIVTANGGIWDFNDRSGDTNEAAGFAAAGSIVNGEYVDSIGGGICQVATTIFNAVFEAGLDVVDRSNHTLFIASYPIGRDAAVSYPELDFAWKNALPSDLLLKLSYTNSSVTAQIYGVATGYSVTSETGEWQEGAKYRTDFEVDDSLSEGMYYTKSMGTDGSQISVTRHVFDKSGKEIKTDTYYSVYAAKNEIVVIGPGTDTSKLGRQNQDSSTQGSVGYWG